MKKNLLMLLTLALTAWAVLPGCAADTEKKPALQSPDTTQIQTLAPAPAADSTAAAEKNAGAEKAEKEKEEKDDDDDRK